MQPDSERQTCTICGRKAIGFQSLGCCAATVCDEHAEPGLRGMKPGETVIWEAGVYYRFPVTDSEGDENQDRGIASEPRSDR